MGEFLIGMIAGGLACFVILVFIVGSDWGDDDEDI